MHDFLANNFDELVARCKKKVARRPRRNATEDLRSCQTGSVPHDRSFSRFARRRISAERHQLAHLRLTRQRMFERVRAGWALDSTTRHRPIGFAQQRALPR